MAAPVTDDKKIVDDTQDVERREDDDDISIQKGDLLSLEHTDPVLNAKMHLINDVSASTAHTSSPMLVGDKSE